MKGIITISNMARAIGETDNADPICEDGISAITSTLFDIFAGIRITTTL